MEKFQYNDIELNLIEKSCLAIAVYQFIDQRVVTIALSAGFLKLFDLSDRAEAYALMDHDMYRDTHPEDIARIADAALRFASEGGEYDVTYRSMIRNEYRIIRARGQHTYTDTGVRLAVIYYSDEGSYDEDSQDGFERSVQDEFLKRTRDLKGHYDPMTGLPGLNYFFELADAAHQAMRENGELPVALYFDFNGMKSFNLRYGFAEGDKLIIAMAKLLTKYFSNENCCRIGGDRFAAFDRYEGLEGKLHSILEESKWINDGKSLPLRIGIYKSRGEEVGIGVACDRAKMACDENRDSRTSEFSYFSDEMLKESELHRYIIDHLDQAIAEGWVKAYYQPIIRSANGRVCDFEALARWIDPVMGFLSPGDFIPVLENARLIYKLDLYIAEQMLHYMKKMQDVGNYIVPCSINISRSDFETCDIVEELRKRVDEAGVGRDMLTVEITESVIGNDLEYIRKQVERFHELGFKVWMDDYGSGYSSPEILQTIPFDTIKLDMQFIRQYEKNKTSGIIISGLVKMALSLGIETVVEGVETLAQVEFLKEIGCTKMQGFHFCKPITYDDIIKRYEDGIQIGSENPAETDYYASIGKVNLYDLSLAVNEDIELQNYFNTVPMAILELDETEFSITRSNQSYRRYMAEHLMIPDVNRTARYSDFEKGPGSSLLRKTLQCARDGRQVLTDEKTADGNISHLLIRRIAVNPVNRKTALIVIVLGMTDEKLADNLTYAHVAQALSADYIDLYYVNLDNEHYMEYLPDADSDDMAIEKRGKSFFSTARADAEKRVYEEDRIMFTSTFTRENVARAIEEHGVFTLTYRIYIDGRPVYVHMKAIRIGTEGNRIIIGVNNVDAQMRHREMMERLKEERVTYSRLTALTGNYYFFYTVDPDTGRYFEYSTSEDAKRLGSSAEGTDFFEDTLVRNDRVIHPEDKEFFREHFRRETILEKTGNGEIFSMTYRLMFDGEPRYVSLRAAMVTEDGSKRLIFGLNDVDAQVRREQEYAHNLSAARNLANIDEQTGVKNHTAFDNLTEQLNDLIRTHSAPPLSVVLLDVDLSKKKDLGEKDKLAYIRQGCMIICKIYRHSPVFRLSDTGFAVISRGDDHEQIDQLMEVLNERNREQLAADNPVILSGMVKYQGESSMQELFDLAREKMQ